MSIRVENIEKSYGKGKALCRVSLEVQPGELFGLIGPDGAGKTTLFRILSTLLLPETGQAWLNRMHVVKEYKAIRRILGYMPGRFSLYQDLTIEENLQFFASIFNVKFDADFPLIRDIYAQIAPFKKRQAGKLSGGMKQKLALCCALVHKPEILLLDEPTTGVDAVSRNEFWDMLSALKKEGITIMVSTPYMDEANRCDRVGLIQKGSIMQIDTPDNIVKAFHKNIFAIKSADLYQVLLTLKDDPTTHAVYPFGQTLHYVPAMDQSGLSAVQHHLKSSGISDFDFQPIQPDIEDCFIELMRHEEAR